MSGKRILIVDDDQTISSVIAEVLSINDENPFPVGTYTEALSLLEQGPFDLIVMDWNIPDMTGPEFLSKLPPDSSATPVIVITGEALLAKKYSRVKKVVGKPFTLSELLKAVNESTGN